MSADFEVSGGGTLYLLTPQTNEAKDWCAEHIDPLAQSLGRGIAVRDTINE